MTDHTATATVTVTNVADYGDGRRITVEIELPAPAGRAHPHVVLLAADEAHAAIKAALTPRDSDDLARHLLLAPEGTDR
jgi:hypothetical protein